MAYQKIILTANNEYFAMRSGQHKTDVLRVNIKGTFANGASLIETTAWTDIAGNIGFADETPFVDSAGTQIEISNSQQVGRSAGNKTIWYIYKVQNATGATNIEFTFNGLEVRYSETAIIENL
jgi:hypothetical protein